ncbi:PREDICTED: DNA-directed RNA polymerase III subunit RPC5 [Tarenaya hassleriana]|uniref:DNA-directed RNA polymerase III subunit RPC5 n=1 Tax=Tarenaya hassleriana TaxID=28532 RepID=UPI00053C5015|nr:PREDICTED: DNA-directed RNA polymerase III subunit RPC5 [Tarenaya hassleriana]
MDLDELEGTREVSARPRKFAPGRAGKPKPKPKSEPKQETAVKAEPKPSHVDTPADAPPAKVEPPPVYDGAVKMEIDSKVDKESESMEAEPINEDRHEQQISVEEEEEQDAVVREIDVFFNPGIDSDTKLYVIQFPLRPSWRAYDLNERCEEVRVKPSTCEVEIDLSIDVHSENYDKDFGSKLNMSKQTLGTTWRPPPALNYAVGVLIGDELHLNPVHAVAQLRPCIGCLSSTGKKKQTAEESVGTSKRMNKGMQSSAEEKTVPEVSWVTHKYLHSEFSSRYLQGMITKERSSIDFNMSPDDYIDSLCPGGSSRSSKSNSQSRRDLLSMSLEERVKQLLCEGSPLLRYSVLKHYAPDHSDEDVLGVLQQHALLVQGWWTPRTRLLNLDGPMAGARDYVLTLFSKDTTIKYSQVDAAGRNKERVKELLKTLAKDRSLLSDWKFKEATDTSFIKRYPDIVKKQEVVWKSIEDKIMPLIQGAKGKTDGRRNISAKPIPTVNTQTAVHSEKGPTRNPPAPRVRRTMSEETRRALPKALKEVFQTHKVCSFQMICQGLRELAVSKANNPKATDTNMARNAAFGADAPTEELEEVISEVAVNIHGSYVLKSSHDHPEYDPLRKVVIDLFCGLGPGARIKKDHVKVACLRVLGRDLTDNEYKKVMNDICESNNSTWGIQTAR